MYTIGLDIGSSAVKCAILDVRTLSIVSTVRYPQEEMAIHAPHPGWAEQHPEDWWDYSIQAMGLALKQAGISGADIASIGVAYQMHGLVAVDAAGRCVRPSIIWCDSRAVENGNKMAQQLNPDIMARQLYNHPGNFTAAKVHWMKHNEPDIYATVHKIMLPGDYIVFRLTGEITTTISGLSEGILYDFSTDTVSPDMLGAAGIKQSLIADIYPSFGECGRTGSGLATILGIPAGVPVTYRAGDQPNNAWALGVHEPGEAAATAGTSGVVYALSKSCTYAGDSGFNTFAHSSHTPAAPCLGNLLCINGTGILYSWIRKQFFGGTAYEAMNAAASACPQGAEGVRIIPFGNGAERILGNSFPGMSAHKIDFNRHNKNHMARAALEGIAFALCFGLTKMQQCGVQVHTIRAGNENLFQSHVFTSVFQQVSGADITLVASGGAAGAAAGAAVGATLISATDWKNSLSTHPQDHIPVNDTPLIEAYEEWKSLLTNTLNNNI